MHRRQAVRLQFRPRREQLGKRLLVAIKQVIGGGLLRRVAHDDPAAVVIGLALDVKGVTGQACFDQGELGGDCGSQRLPLLPRRIDGDRLRLEALTVGYQIGDVGAVALEQCALFPGGPVDLHHGGLIALDG